VYDLSLLKLEISIDELNHILQDLGLGELPFDDFAEI